jgi:hypothetical protein
MTAKNKNPSVRMKYDKVTISIASRLGVVIPMLQELAKKYGDDAYISIVAYNEDYETYLEYNRPETPKESKDRKALLRRQKEWRK